MELISFILLLLNIAYVFVEWHLFVDDSYLNTPGRSRVVCVAWGVGNVILSYCEASGTLLGISVAVINTALCIIVALCINHKNVTVKRKSSDRKEW